jgi:hypothetical protein
VAEVDGRGRVLRTASAAVAGLRAPVRVYAFAPRHDVDRLLTTSAPMMEDSWADVVQVWRLSDLALLHTLPVPPRGSPTARRCRAGISSRSSRA